MSTGHDLQVDTDWIRRSASSLEQTGRHFVAAASAQPVVPIEALGSDATAMTVARLIGLRCGHAEQAAIQLGSVAAGTAQNLTTAADTFDRLDAGVRWPR